MLEMLFMGFVVVCGVLAYSLVGIWHLQVHMKKYGHKLHWAQFILCVFWWLNIIGYMVYCVDSISKNSPIQSYEDF